MPRKPRTPTANRLRSADRSLPHMPDPPAVSGWIASLRNLLSEIQSEGDRLSLEGRQALLKAADQVQAALPPRWLSGAGSGEKSAAGDGRSTSVPTLDGLSLLLVGRRARRLLPLFEGLVGGTALPHLTFAQGARSASRELSRKVFDVVFVCTDANAGESLSLLTAVRSVQNGPPAICVAEDGDEELAAAAFRGGAYDYLPRRELSSDRLQEAVRQALQRRRLEQELEEAHARLAELVNRDPLTGLFNRRHFDSRLSAEFARALRFREPLALLLVDIDHFKTINDRYGHPNGDRVLVEIGQRLCDRLRQIDLVARLGGDEFALILPNTSAPGALQVASRMVDRAREAPVMLTDQALAVTVSVGVAAMTECRADTGQDLLECADRALYEAKRGGRDRIAGYRSRS